MPSGTRIRSRTNSRYSDAGHRGDHAAEDPVAQVRVLERRPRRPRERRPGGEQPLEGVEREALLPVAPRVVRREPGRHRHQLADRDRRASRSWAVASRRAPGTWSATGSSRRSRPSSRSRSSAAAVKLLVIDAMRYTASASGRRSSPSRIVPAPAAWTRTPSRTTPQATPGDPRLLAESLEPRVERRQQVVERGHATIMPDRPSFVGAATCAGVRPVPSSTNTRNASTSRKPMAS